MRIRAYYKLNKIEIVRCPEDEARDECLFKRTLSIKYIFMALNFRGWSYINNYDHLDLFELIIVKQNKKITGYFKSFREGKKAFYMIYNLLKNEDTNLL